MMRWRKQSTTFVSLFSTAAAFTNKNAKGLFNGNVRRRCLVSFHGHATRLSPRFRSRDEEEEYGGYSSNNNNNDNRPRGSGGVHRVMGDEPPPDPNQFLTKAEQDMQVEQLLNWYLDDDKHQILCITGAGLSTESGIADYRGHQGSYYKGHQPMVHDHFMSSQYQRQRYWGRGMVGWRPFVSAQPNAGHYALATLEQRGKLGVTFDDQLEFYNDQDIVGSNNKYRHNNGHSQQSSSSSSLRRLALITQNVDSLHIKAGSRDVIELHGRSERVKCMNCGALRDRGDFHGELERLNGLWLAEARAALAQVEDSGLRPDGDADVSNQRQVYEEVIVPNCDECGVGFFKPDIVFFGDSVPSSRVAQCRAAVDHCDGVLVVGSSLAVHSAFRHVKAACARGVPVAILNVGPTRAEVEQLPGLLKLSAPAGTTLDRVVQFLEDEEYLTPPTVATATSSSTDSCPATNTAVVATRVRERE